MKKKNLHFSTVFYNPVKQFFLFLNAIVVYKETIHSRHSKFKS